MMGKEANKERVALIEARVEEQGHTKSLDSTKAKRLFVKHRSLLWGMAYRMVGIPSDADDLLQECFIRLLDRPPPDLDRELRPWLVRVLMNLARDQLRARKRDAYIGPWLPGLIEDARVGGSGESRFGELSDLEESSVQRPDTRYSLLESLSLSFLLAAEKLNPQQRAVLVLRDVFGYSVKESAELLEQSEANIKTTLHRARAQMKTWEDKSRRPLLRPHAEVLAKMMQFIKAIELGDRKLAETMLADDVRFLSDGGGEFFAARKPVLGAAKVALFCHRLMEMRTHENYSMRTELVNGLPSLILQRREEGLEASDPEKEKTEPVSVVQIQIDESGRIREIYSVLAPRKVSAIARE